MAGLGALGQLPTNAELPQSGSLTARWLLNKSGGGSETDNSGNGYTATDVNTVQVASPGKYDSYCRDLELSNMEFFDCGNNFTPSEKFTIAGWINIESISTFGPIFGRWTDGSYLSFLASLDATRHLLLRINGATRATGGTALGLSSWCHAGFTYDKTAGSNNAKVFLAGSNDGQDAYAVDVTNFGMKARIGATTDGDSEIFVDYEFDGKMQDLCYWEDTTLTETEMATLYGLYPHMDNSFLLVL